MLQGWLRQGVYPSPIPHADVVTSDDAQDAARAARRHHSRPSKNDELTKKFNSLVFPGMQGGPLMHVIAAKAVAFKEALEPWIL